MLNHKKSLIYKSLYIFGNELTMKYNTTYCFNSSLRIYDNNNSEIRFRNGLWNYNEAVLDLKNESIDFNNTFRCILKELKSKDGFKLENIDNYNLNEDDKNNLINILNSLNEAGMILSKSKEDTSIEVSKVLLGDFRYNLTQSNDDKKVLFISDNTYSNKIAKELSKLMDFKIDLCSEEIIKTIGSKDVTSNLDALATKTDLESIKSYLKDYSQVLICMSHLNINLFRNINRAMIELKKPIVASFIDGPFITTLSILPPKTGCLECFEERILSRMEDHTLYHKFIENDFQPNKDNNSIIPLLNIMTNLLLSEGFLIKNFNTCKFEGRVLNIFIPTLEMQTQDLLRVPFCPACGNVSKAKLKEINISTRNIVDEILDDINDMDS